MSVEDDLRVIFATYPEGKYAIDTIQLSHPLFTQTYSLTRQPDGIVADTETHAGVHFDGANFEVSLNSNRSDLDKTFSFTIPDVFNFLDDELDRIPLDNAYPIKCIYRAYNSDDFTAPSYGPFSLDVIDISQEKGVFTITASASLLNWNSTGLRYDFDKFQALRALL